MVKPYAMHLNLLFQGAFNKGLSDYEQLLCV